MEADETYARELSLFATNDGALYAQAIKPYLHNLARKEARGVYDQFAAMKGWRHIADEATRRYSTEMCGYAKATLTICNRETRNLAAAEIAESYDELLSELAAEETEKRNFKANEKALVARFLRDVAPCIPANDKPMIRAAFHDWKDGLHRDGAISEYLVQHACLPAKWN